MRHTPARPILIAIVILALCVAAALGVRTVRHALYWSNPAHRDVAPEGWMTLGYLERSHELSRHSLGPALGLAPQPGEPLSLEEIAALRQEPLAQLLAEVGAVIEAAKQ